MDAADTRLCATGATGIADVDETKLGELMLYIAEKSTDDPSFGAVKLNKLLFFADFFAYGLFGSPITGATYRKLEMGPVPRQLLQVQARLVKNGDATIRERRYFKHVQKRLLPSRQPNLSSFTGQEIEFVDELIADLRNMSATSVSDLSHELALGWQLASYGQDIPYEAVFLSTEPLTESDIAHGKELALQYGW